MIPELGHFALILALCLALAQGILPLIGAHRGNLAWMALARPAATGQFVFLAIAFLSLTYCFVVNDFSVLYVASNSNSALPVQYRVAAVWGAHEGSLLLWACILSVWTLAVTIYSRSLPQAMVARVIAVMGLISVGFILFMLTTSNPFERLFPAALDGRDLNPLLQDPGLIFHPPMLYMGYVGFSVAFAFAIAALLGGHLDATWARWSRPWTLISWTFLTTGIALGSWWAYYELGWGGWWFWDPVENASFMPWLVGTALIHSLAVTEKRGAFKPWTVLLAIFAFSLSLLGTFLVRSGVLVSVHAFATDPGRGVFILAFLATVIGSSLVLYAWRAPRVKSGGTFAGFSRESLLLINNVILVTAAVSVLLGTLYPLILDALGLGKISVGPPYFATVFVPLMLPLAVLIGIGPLTRWKQDDPTTVMRRLLPYLIGATVSGVALLYAVAQHMSIMTALSVVIALWVFATALRGLFERARKVQGGWRSVPRAFIGMTVAHLGVGVFILGVTLTGAYNVEKDMRMDRGTSAVIAGYTFTFEGVKELDGPNYTANQGTVHVTRDGQEIVTLHPEKRTYRVQTMPMTEASIDAGVFRDLYVSLGEPVDSGAWSVRVYYKPFIRWIWSGALLMALGGVFAASDRRYRVAVRAGVKVGTQAAAARA
ncbi:MAG: cytochrome biosis protein [Proteobacteria bacterium]|nr:cytochrome biosis protein [Pseudomonadota bacterium]